MYMVHARVLRAAVSHTVSMNVIHRVAFSGYNCFFLVEKGGHEFGSRSD
jgi:hypothetical protein